MYKIKWVLLICIAVSIQSTSWAQDDNLRNYQQFNSIDYRKLLSNEQTKILNGDNSLFGGFASLKTEDKIATFSGNIPISEFNSINLSIKGGATEGIVSLFNKEKVNPNIEFGIQLNLGLYGNTKVALYTDATKLLSYLSLIDSTQNVLAQVKSKNSTLLKQLEIENFHLTKKVSKISTDINQLESHLSLSQEDIIKVDSLKLEHQKLTLQLSQSNNYLQHLNTGTNIQDETAHRDQVAIENSESTIDKIEKNIVLTAYTLKWFSIFANLNNRTFNFYDPNLEFINQVKKQRTNNYEFGLSGNIFHNSSNNFSSLFGAIGASYKSEDNFSSLDESTITETTKITDNGLTRTNTTNKKVYSGEYNSSLKYLKLYVDFYWFLDKEQSIALHFNPEVRRNFNEFNEDNYTLGLFLSLQDKENQKSKINIELFYKKTNQTFSNDTDAVLNSQLGVKTTFPFNF